MCGINIPLSLNTISHLVNGAMLACISSKSVTPARILPTCTGSHKANAQQTQNKYNYNKIKPYRTIQFITY